MYRSSTHFGANKPNGNKTGRTSNTKKSAVAIEPTIEAKYKSKSIPRFIRLYTYNKNKKAAEMAKLNETAKPKAKHNQGFKHSYLPRAKSSIGCIGISKNKPREGHVIKPSSTGGGNGSRNSVKCSSSYLPKNTSGGVTNKNDNDQKLHKSNFTQIRNGAIINMKKSLADAPQSHSYKTNESKNEFSIIDNMPLQKPKAVMSENNVDSEEESSKYMFISPIEGTTCDFTEFDTTTKQPQQKSDKKQQSKKPTGLRQQKTNRNTKTVQKDTKKLQSKMSTGLKSHSAKTVQQDKLVPATDEVASQRNIRDTEEKPSVVKIATKKKSTVNKSDDGNLCEQLRPTSNRSSRQEVLAKTLKPKETKSKLHNGELVNKNVRSLMRVRNEKRN